MYNFLPNKKGITLKGKLITAFIGLIVVPLVILGYFSIELYSNEIQNTVIKSAVQSNEQVIKNLDNFFEMLSKLSEYPIKDATLKSLIVRDYSTEKYPGFEQAKDFDTSKQLLYYNIKSFSDMIDSVLIYKAGTYEIRGRTPTDSLNSTYDPSTEQWFDKFEKQEGGCVIVGIHKELQQSRRGNYVISVGRSIVNPDTKKSIGYVIINVAISSLEKLWMDTKLTNNSKFFLVDENDHIVFSKDEAQINRNIYDVFGKMPYLKDSGYVMANLMGRENYLISSQSEISGWRVITVIPKNELFSYINTMFRITLLVGAVLIFLSVVVAIFIATGVTRPLYKLKQKMRLVGKGDFDVDIDSTGGEIGDISNAVKMMILEIKRLIRKIYEEEAEKRSAEMNALQAQINPHFLYNTLNTIKWMANIQGATGIENALNSLSSLFAFTAKSSGEFVSMKDEVKFIQDYLNILRLRYYNRFSVDYEIEEEVYKYKTLKFLLQPVIENAIFHGIEGVERKGILKLCIYLDGSSLVFRVEDNGKGISSKILDSIFAEEKAETHGKFNSIGIPNIQKRIKLHFGEEYGIDIKSVDEQGTTITIRVPAIGLDN